MRGQYAYPSERGFYRTRKRHPEDSVIRHLRFRINKGYAITGRKVA